MAYASLFRGMRQCHTERQCVRRTASQLLPMSCWSAAAAGCAEEPENQQ